MCRPIIEDEAGGRQCDLGTHRTKPDWRISSHSLPFSELSDDEFERFRFLLLRKANPDDRVYYYGKTGDAGRDIIHPLADGKHQLIQCKRYTSNVGIDVIRKEFAKLYYNILYKIILQRPDEVVFYVTPDLTYTAIDLVHDPATWRSSSYKALKEHTGVEPASDLLQFAKSWWPNCDYQNALRLTERCNKYPDLRHEFFGVR